MEKKWNVFLRIPPCPLSSMGFLAKFIRNIVLYIFTYYLHSAYFRIPKFLIAKCIKFRTLITTNCTLSTITSHSLSITNYSRYILSLTKYSVLNIPHISPHWIASYPPPFNFPPTICFLIHHPLNSLLNTQSKSPQEP